MKIAKFEISNFKGIEHATIHIADDTPGNINTFIGLNESGKTTLLEAMSYFVTEDKDTANLVGTVFQKSALQDIIPKDKKAAFTGKISIKAFVTLEEDDVSALSKIYKHHKMDFEELFLKREITVDRIYRFEDSSHIETSTIWSVRFKIKSVRAKKYVIYDGAEGSIKADKAVWLIGVNLLRERLPKIVYFPTFLFNFPDRIYLEGEDSQINSYYKQVVQDVLDSQGDKLQVQQHFVDRIERLKEQHPVAATFIAFLFGQDEKKQIDAVLQKASNEMSKVIFGSWNQILGKPIAGKRVQIDWLLDSERNNAPYLELFIVDGQSKYSLSERSLGFRWFFSFLLFTQFRRNRLNNGGTIFLFDEPAANLHSKAQIKLLESFSRIVTDSTYIIYSTHSHYMVNPYWLERAYIIENKAADYDNEDEIEAFALRKTDIRAVRYRTFVGSYPTKTTYFQPVLDALDVSFSPLIRESKAIIIEGKNDFHAFSYLCLLFGKSKFPPVFPSNGAGHAGCLISLFRGWGVRFVIVLDDDRAGRQAKEKYTKEYLLEENEVATLGDMNPELTGKEFEAIYMDDVKSEVCNLYTVDNPSKKQYSLYFQEQLATSSKKDFPLTQRRFQPVFDWLVKALL